MTKYTYMTKANTIKIYIKSLKNHKNQTNPLKEKWANNIINRQFTKEETVNTNKFM